MPTALEIIQDLKVPLQDALTKATTDADRQKIEQQLQALSDLDLEITQRNFTSGIAELQAVTEALRKIIAELRGHIDNLFMDQLAQAGRDNGVA